MDGDGSKNINDHWFTIFANDKRDQELFASYDHDHHHHAELQTLTPTMDPSSTTELHNLEGTEPPTCNLQVLGPQIIQEALGEEDESKKRKRGEEVMDDESKKRKRGDDEDDRLMQETDQRLEDPELLASNDAPSMDTTTNLEGSDDDKPPTYNQLKEVDSSTPLLDLKLTISESYRRSLEFSVWKTTGCHVVAPEPDNVGSSHQPQPHQPMSSMSETEKLKASNFEITSISIGSWQRVSKREGELTAKVYFAKKKLVWEFLDGELKSKIEMRWSDITAINAHMPPNHSGTLQIELGNPPLFYRELKPLPKKHTNWQPTSDFTNDHASLNRRHFVSFPSGVLDIQIEKLLQFEPRLFELSKKPFPSKEESPLYFNNVMQMPINVMQMPNMPVQFDKMPQLIAFNTGVGVDKQSIYQQPQFQQYPNHLQQAYNSTPLLFIEASPHDHRAFPPLPPHFHEQAFTPPLHDHAAYVNPFLPEVPHMNMMENNNETPLLGDQITDYSDHASFWGNWNDISPTHYHSEHAQCNAGGSFFSVDDVANTHFNQIVPPPPQFNQIAPPPSQFNLIVPTTPQFNPITPTPTNLSHHPTLEEFNNYNHGFPDLPFNS